jgi:hypothetical protein
MFPSRFSFRLSENPGSFPLPLIGKKKSGLVVLHYVNTPGNGRDAGSVVEPVLSRMLSEKKVASLEPTASRSGDDGLSISVSPQPPVLLSKSGAGGMLLRNLFLV